MVLPSVILHGVSKLSLDVKNMEVGEFCVKFHVHSKVDGFDWALVAVYGAAQADLKPAFLSELVRICVTVSSLVGGVRGGAALQHYQTWEEKNNANFDARWFPFMFNAIIENMYMREIVLSGRQFTSNNNLPCPTYENLNSPLASVEWEQKFPLVII